jgi:hypothetical protein
MNLKSYKIILFTILISILIELSLSQRRGNNNQRKVNNRNRGTNVEPLPSKRINCYSCYVDFTLQKFDNQHLCYNPSLNITLADQEHLTQCSPVTRFCTVDITRVNNVLAVVDRRCGLSTCRHFCLAKGYGVERETCTYCCGGKLREDEEGFDQKESDNYKCPTIPH